ncbi:hypothetical protein CROQUDRAFT_673001 [Cronartium quercuum f. sp. fusiforme G11]|uniref:BHLH domain-containing protein n=1 Tax=Cronartium quercuum f. sp. fusiforme G11 TaxID=708437 RepID=A0A9P6TA96_9BASI|nr:hypothetical protein CROQUDRAFT_673001 [Cronartium quercuum f. sp. fusiforme G11]
MAVSSGQPHNHRPSGILGEDFLNMPTFVGFRGFVPNHSPSTTTSTGSDHSASVSPPAYGNLDSSALADQAHTTLFADDEELEDDSFSGLDSKFHARFHSNEPKQDPKTSAAHNKLKISTAERRATHNAIERARRESLNGRFLELARALPTMGNVKRPSKSVIVNKSLEWICESQVREYHLVRENNYLRAQVNELRSQLQLGPLPPANYAAPLHMQAKDLRSASIPNHQPINLPIVPNLSAVDIPGPGVNTINLSLPAKLGHQPPDRSFNPVPTKDVYAHPPPDQQAGPFIAPQSHHTFAINPFQPGLGPDSALGLSFGAEQQLPTFQTGYDPEGISPRSGGSPNLATSFYPSASTSSDEGSASPSGVHAFKSNATEKTGSVDLFGSGSVDGGLLSNTSHVLPPSAPNPGQITESIMDLMQAQAQAQHLNDGGPTGNFPTSFGSGSYLY